MRKKYAKMQIVYRKINVVYRWESSLLGAHRDFVAFSCGNKITIDILLSYMIT